MYQKNQNIVTRKIVDETILVPIRGNVADMQKLFMLNPVAEFIWEHLEANTPVESICADVIDNFEVTRAEAEKDVYEFVRELRKFNLINEVIAEKESV